MLESKIEKEVCAYAKKLNWLVYKFSSPSNKGVPDRIFVSPKGCIIFIEFKAPKAKPTRLQMKVINRMTQYNCNVFVVDDIENGKFIINNND